MKVKIAKKEAKMCGLGGYYFIFFVLQLKQQRPAQLKLLRQ